MKQKSFYLRCLAVLLSLALTAGFLTGCNSVKGLVSNAASTGTFPVTIDEVTISAKPQKVVALSGSMADVVLALGYETQLIASSDDCTQEVLQDLTKVSATDSGAVTALAPDLVISDSFSEDMLSALAAANITALPITPAKDRSDFERMYSQVASALAGDGVGYDAGIACAQDIFITLDNISRIVPKDKVTTACYLYDLDGKAITGEMLGSTIMTYSGVTNVFKGTTGGAYEIDTLRVSNPNVIFCPPGLKDTIKSDPRFQNFIAVKNDKIFEMEPSMIEWQGRTIITTAYEISAAAFPELLEENSMVVTDPTSSGTSSEASPAPGASPAASATPAPVTYAALTMGDSGDDVLRLQQRLEALGYSDVEYDGTYDDYTAAAVRDFQQVNGITETGDADDGTQQVLYSGNAKNKLGETVSAAATPTPVPAEPTPSPAP